MAAETISAARFSNALRATFALALLTSSVACDVPRFKGPQIQGITPGFLNKPDVGWDKIMFPDRPTVHFDAWVRTDVDTFDGIYITGHPGSTSPEEVERAREESMAVRGEQKLQYGELEFVVIDGRASMAWMEAWEDDGLHALTLRTVIPYDTVTYIVEFHAGDPMFKTRPESMRAIVSTFAIGRTEWSAPLLALGVGVSLLLFGAVGARVRAGPYPSSRNMTLITLPAEAEEPVGSPSDRREEVDSDEASEPEAVK